LKTILNEQQLGITIQRLTHQLLENHLDLQNTVLIGIQPRGVYFSDRIVGQLKTQVDPASIHYGQLDITFYRDDVRTGLHELNRTDIPFSVENKEVVLIDDVLFWPAGESRAVCPDRPALQPAVADPGRLHRQTHRQHHHPESQSLLEGKGWEG